MLLVVGSIFHSMVVPKNSNLKSIKYLSGLVLVPIVFALLKENNKRMQMARYLLTHVHSFPQHDP